MARLKRLFAATFVAAALTAALALPVLAHPLPTEACNEESATARTSANAAATERMPHSHPEFGLPCVHVVGLE